MSNRCVCCGEEIPEGRMVCSACDEKVSSVKECTLFTELWALKAIEECHPYRYVVYDSTAGLIKLFTGEPKQDKDGVWRCGRLEDREKDIKPLGRIAIGEMNRVFNLYTFSYQG